ncbi:MAG: hypothetical protein ABIR84_01750 [Candidatus Nitrotoga sp.]
MKFILLIVIASLSACAVFPNSTSQLKEAPISALPLQQEQDSSNCVNAEDCGSQSLGIHKKNEIAQRKKDEATCSSEAKRATDSAANSYSEQGAISNTMSSSFHELELIQHCMKSKGYTW